MLRLVYECVSVYSQICGKHLKIIWRSNPCELHFCCSSSHGWLHCRTKSCRCSTSSQLHSYVWRNVNCVLAFASPFGAAAGLLWCVTMVIGAEWGGGRVLWAGDEWKDGSTRAPVGRPRGFECGDGRGCVCVCELGRGGSSVHEGNVAQSRHKQCLFTSLLLPKWAWPCGRVSHFMNLSGSGCMHSGPTWIVCMQIQICTLYTANLCVCVWVCFFRHVVLFTFRVCHCGKYPPQTGPAAPCRDHWACSVRPGWGARCAARPPTGSLPLSQNIRAPWRAHCWCPWTDWGWSHLRERSR